MNKFILIALVACAAVATAEPEPIDIETFSQSAINPTDSEETAGLTGNNVIFSDFCLQSRDHVLGDMKRTGSKLASGVFSMFFNSAEKMGLETLEAQKDATDRLSEQLRNPSTPVDVKDQVDEGREQIHEDGDNVAKGFFHAITNALMVTKNTIAAQIRQRIQDIKAQFGFDQALSALSETCSKVAQYEEELRAKFDTMKTEVVAKDASLANVQIDQVQCLTSKRILRIEGLCKFARIAQNPLFKMLTYRQ